MESSEIGYDKSDPSTLEIAIENVWNIIQKALSRGRVVECGAGSDSIDGLTTNHAYSVLGAFSMQDDSETYHIF